MTTRRITPTNGSSRKPRTTARTGERPTLTYEDVAKRAFELFLQRGGTHGQDRDDWLSAESQLQSVKP